MGILQFFQKIRNIRSNGVASSELRKPTISNQTQSTKSDLSNDTNLQYLATRENEVLKLEQAYDFNSIEGIESIPVPAENINGNSPTGRVEYYLRGKCFFDHWEAGRIDLALACLRKAQELMYVSDMIWKRPDFLRLVEYLEKAGYSEEAKIELEKIDDYFSVNNEWLDNVKRQLDSAKDLETDLIEVRASCPVYGKCAAYRNRIYSISGKDERFPALPMDIITSGHGLSCLSFWPFIYGIMEPSFDCDNIISYSNRPFVDDRTQYEIDRYTQCQIAVDRRKAQEKAAEIYKLENAKAYKEDSETLQWLQSNLPALCPKSVTGLRRMRNANSSNWQKIVEQAKTLGKTL